MTEETLTPEQAHHLLDLMAKGEGGDEGMDAGVALTLADIALQIDQPERAQALIAQRAFSSAGDYQGWQTSTNSTQQVCHITEVVAPFQARRDAPMLGSLFSAKTLSFILNA